MLDERSPRSLFTEANALELRKLSSGRVIDHVMVGLMVNRRKGSNLVDEAVRRNAFQRRAALLAHGMGGVLAGQVGDHGVVFLCGSGGSANQKKRRLHELTERASSLAKKDFDLSLHFGAASAGESQLLSPSYHAALAASESALNQDRPLVMAAQEVAHAPNSLRGLRAELAHVEERPPMLAARFERYLEAVSLHCGHRLETALAHLEVGFEDMGASLLEAGVLEAKSLATMRSALWRAAADARSTNEVFAAYRRAFADVSDAVERPVPARRDRSLHRAVEYIRNHFTESLRISAVARVAGFTRSHFSRLFIEREGMPFEDYVMRLRLERSRQLLTDTELSVGRVAELSGFASPQYFCRVFRRVVKITPSEFRQAPRRARNESTMTNSPRYNKRKREAR
jgi:AraC-like DNA-binding protein